MFWIDQKEEKEKWHTLCLKLVRERDTTRQRISALITSEHDTHLSSSSVPASSAQEKDVASRASKLLGGREDSTLSAQDLPS